MNTKATLALSLLFFSCSLNAQDAMQPAGNDPSSRTGYVDVNIDKIVVNTRGLESASATLAKAIDELALAIRSLASDDNTLTDTEKETLLSAVKSVDQASVALAELATSLPQSAQALTDRLPEVVANAREPIAELSSGLESARAGIFAITESLPEATENAKSLINATLDAALIKISTYTMILIALLALALLGVLWFFYQRYVAPIARILAPLATAPEQFAQMSMHMSQTSDNLLALQSGRGQRPASSLDYSRNPPSSSSIRPL